MKSKFKFLSLVNGSGFHVDPDYKGRILFTVYNAGPDDITLKCGEKASAIWFAKLDNNSSTFFYDTKKNNYNRNSITSEDVNKFVVNYILCKSIKEQAKAIIRKTLNLDHYNYCSLSCSAFLALLEVANKNATEFEALQLSR